MIKQIIDEITKHNPQNIMVSWIDSTGNPQCAIVGNTMALSYLLKILDHQISDLIARDLVQRDPITIIDNN